LIGINRQPGHRERPVGEQGRGGYGCEPSPSSAICVIADRFRSVQGTWPCTWSSVAPIRPGI